MSLMNTTGTEELINVLEDLSGLVLAINSLHWTTVTVAFLGVVSNVVTYLSARELVSDTSGTALIENMSLIDVVVTVAVGVLPGSELMGQQLLNINDYFCKAGIFLTSWISLWGEA